MGILGKLLLVVNVLAGGAFVYLGVQDWKARQTITAAGVRHLLLLNGIPLDGGPDTLPPRVAASSDTFDDYAATEIPFRIEMAGGTPVESVSPELLYVYFGAAGAGTANPATGVDLGGTVPVASQLAEVRRVRGLIKTAVDANRLLAANYLILLAQSIEERAEVQALAAARNGDKLAALLDKKFEQVLNPPARPDVSSLAVTAAPDDASLKERAAKADEIRGGAAKDGSERATRLAHLLVHLDTGAAWQKRVAMVVGLRRYVRVVVDQTLRLREMVARVDRSIADDQERFAGEYSKLRDLAIGRTRMAKAMKEDRDRIQAQVARNTDFVAQRQTQLADLKAELVKVKAEVDQLLARQALTEQQLFEVQREVGLTLEGIFQLEADLAKKEIERYGGK